MDAFGTEIEETGFAPATGATDDTWDEDEVIAQALRLVAEEHAALGATIGRAAPPPSLAELRQSPLGRDLRLLAAGRDGTPAEEILAAARRVEEVLLRPLAADGYAVPGWFRGTALGKLVGRAERAARRAEALVAPAEAAARLGVPTTAVEGWLAEGLLGGVVADGGGVLVPVDEVERRRAVARALTEDPGDVLLAERSLAS